MAMPVTAGTLALIGGARYTTHWRLLIEDADGAMRDYSDQQGIDWRKSADWGKTVDSPIADGSVEVFMEADGISLAPLIGGSPLNRNSAGGYAKAIDMARRLEIWTQDTEVGVAPVELDWVLVHDAIVQKVAKGSGVLKLSTLDRASLLNRIIRHDLTYGTEAGTPVATVMQNLIDDTLGAGVFTLALDGDPQYAIAEAGPFTDRSLWDALEALSAEFAGYVEYRDALTLVTPDRSTPTATSAVATIGPDQYKTVPRLDTDLADIRNDIDVTFRNRTSGAIDTVNAVDAASKADYGEQYMGVTLGEDSAIDTTAEAQDMADRIVSDIGVPRYNQQVVNFYWYPVELGDHITWQANGRDYDSDQHWAVTGYRHSLSRDKRETTFDVRGKASAGFKRWTRKGDEEDRRPDPDLTLSVTPLEKTETAHRYRITRDDPSIAEIWRYSRTVPQDAVVPDIETVQATDEPVILTVPAAGYVDVAITVPDPPNVTYEWYVGYTADLQPGIIAGPVEVDPLDRTAEVTGLDVAYDGAGSGIITAGVNIEAVSLEWQYQGDAEWTSEPVTDQEAQWPVTQTKAERTVYVRALNGFGYAGPERSLDLEAYDPPPVLLSASLDVDESPAGSDADYLFAWTVGAGVNDTDHRVRLIAYEEDSGIKRVDVGDILPSASPHTERATGDANGLEADYRGKVFLYAAVGGETLGSIETPPTRSKI